MSYASYAASASWTNACVRSTSQRSSGARSPWRCSAPHDGREACDVRVVDEELRRVPEGEEAPLDVVGEAVAELQRLARRLRAVQPAHHVGAHPLERLVQLDRVAGRLVHRLALLVEHLLVREDAPVRRPAGERHRHEALRVEPQPDLLAHLRHPVGREPLLPVRVVGEIRAGERRGGAGRVAVRDPFGVVPAERREVDDARVEPGVADLGDALELGVARRAADPHGVDPRPVQLLELLEPRHGALLELGPRADDVQLAARARIEGQRQPEVALARDVPVVHVAQPVVHPLLVLRRCPLDGRVRVEHRLADLLCGDEPVVDDAEDERRLAAPADRVAVDDRPLGGEQAARVQRVDHTDGDFRRREARELAVRRQHPPRLVDRREHGQVVNAGELEVLRARPRRDVHDPGPFVERDLVPRDDTVDDARLRVELVERPRVLEADEVGAAHGAHEALVREPRDRDPAAVGRQAVVRIGLHRRGDVRGQRPRRRRPDDERLAVASAQREADVERRVLHLDVVLLARLLVLGERGPAARAPLRGAVPLVQPAALVDGLEEAPDVLDVRVAERVVVVVPVHPLAEAAALVGHDLAVVRDALDALAGELGEAVLLDLVLRREAEGLLHLDLDPEPLGVEAVLVALVEALHRLVALEDVLQRPPVAVVDAGGVVGRDRAVHEREPGPAAVLLAQLLEGRPRRPSGRGSPPRGRDGRVPSGAAETLAPRASGSEV